MGSSYMYINTKGYLSSLKCVISLEALGMTEQEIDFKLC